MFRKSLFNIQNHQHDILFSQSQCFPVTH